MTADTSTDTSEDTPEDNKPPQTATAATVAQLRHLIDMERGRTHPFSPWARGYIHGLERAIIEISYYQHHHETRGDDNGETPA